MEFLKFGITSLFGEEIAIITPYIQKYAGVIFIFGCVAVVNTVVRFVVKGKGASSSSNDRNANEPVQDKSSDDTSDSSDSAAYAKETEEQQQKQAEIEQELKKQAEEQRLLAEKEELNNLFKLESKGAEQKSLQEKEQEKQKKEKEQEELKIELGSKRQELTALKDKYTALFSEMSAGFDKGVTFPQIAQGLMSQPTQDLSLVEMSSLIEVMSNFLNQKSNFAKDSSILGLDPMFEQKLALTALKHGEFDKATDFLSRQASELEHLIASTRRDDIRTPAKQELASLYFSIGILARPNDADKCFECLQKAQELNPSDLIITALIARTCYETGNTKGAENIFEDILESEYGSDMAKGYAMEMIPVIKSERMYMHAARIRQSYEAEIEDAEGNQLQSEKAMPELAKNNQRSSFVLNEARERQAEREMG